MRPKDDRGVPLPPASERLQEAPQLRQAGAIAMAADSRSSIMTTSRKVSLLNRVINHVVDGDAIPKSIYDKDESRPENHCMVDLWRLAEKAVAAKWAQVKPAAEARR